MQKIYESHFTQIIRRAKNVVSLRIKKPPNFQYFAGQFMFITFKSLLGVHRKHLTISSSPTEPFLEVTKRITESGFSKGLLEKKPGDLVQLEGPYGDFIANVDYPKIGMMCGGIGITPLRSMIKFFADKSQSNDLVLIYSNKTIEAIGFKDELDSLMEKKNFNFKVFYTLTQPKSGWEGETGRINQEMVKKLMPDFKRRIFCVSGPPAMVDTICNLLIDLKVNDINIKVETFGGYTLHPEINF